MTKSPEHRIRVVIDGAVLSRPPTGTARWVRGLASALAAVPGLNTALAVGPGYIRRGGRLHRIPNLVRERWWYERGLPQFARGARADVLLLPANLTARKGRIPQVVTILDVNFLSQPGTYERTFVRYATWAYRRSIREAAGITTISRFSRSEIATHLEVDPDRISVIYPGIDTPPERPDGPGPHARPYALYVGATERHKNVGLLLDAWRDHSPGGLDLVLVGQPGRDHALATQSASKTGGRVTVVGAVGANELERWYTHAELFLFPSRVEGFGYPPLEAMQRGVAVLSSSAGSLPEVLGDGAWYFDPDDRGALMSLIEQLAGDPPTRAELIARGRDVASRYAWPTTGGAMAQVLTEVVIGMRD